MIAQPRPEQPGPAPGSTPLAVVHVACSAAFAGVERHVAELAVAQAATGLTVHVVGGDPERMRAALHPAGVAHSAGASVPAAARRLRQLLRAGEVDVLHAHMTAAETAAVLGRIAARRTGVPIVVTRHFAARRGSTPLRRQLTGLTARRIATQVAVSGYVAAQVDGASTVVHPGVPDRPDGAPAESRDRTILLAQRLEPEKRTDLALAAFARSGVAGQGWRLVVAGDGSQRGALERSASALGVDRAVDFLGRRTDVEALMARAGLLLAPCPVEGLGLAVLEAMSAGLPVVAAAAGGHLETAGAVAPELLYPPADVGAAARVIASLSEDPAARTAYGKALQEAQRHDFTLARQAAETERVYRNVLP